MATWGYDPIGWMGQQVQCSFSQRVFHPKLMKIIMTTQCTLLSTLIVFQFSLDIILHFHVLCFVCLYRHKIWLKIFGCHKKNSEKHSLEMIQCYWALSILKKLLMKVRLHKWSNYHCIVKEWMKSIMEINSLYLVTCQPLSQNRLHKLQRKVLNPPLHVHFVDHKNPIIKRLVYPFVLWFKINH